MTGPMSDLWIPEPRRPGEESWAAPGVRASDPETSAAAAVETGLERRAHRDRLFAAVQNAGPNGLTDEEAARRVGLWSTRSCWWKRMSELRADGRIEFTKRTRPGAAGRQRKVSVVSDS